MSPPPQRHPGSNLGNSEGPTLPLDTHIRVAGSPCSPHPQPPTPGCGQRPLTGPRLRPSPRPNPPTRRTDLTDPTPGCHPPRDRRPTRDVCGGSPAASRPWEVGRGREPPLPGPQPVPSGALCLVHACSPTSLSPSLQQPDATSALPGLPTLRGRRPLRAARLRVPRPRGGPVNHGERVPGRLRVHGPPDSKISAWAFSLTKSAECASRAVSPPPGRAVRHRAFPCHIVPAVPSGTRDRKDPRIVLLRRDRPGTHVCPSPESWPVPRTPAHGASGIPRSPGPRAGRRVPSSVR